MNEQKNMIDAYMGAHGELVRDYIKRGLSKEAAEDKAADDIRRQIRQAPARQFQP